MPPTTHSRFGASKSSRWRNCPGSIAAEDGLPDTPTEYAIIGTAAHDLAERCLTEDLDSAAFVGETITVAKDGLPEPREIEVTAEMAEAVQVYLDFVRQAAGPDDVMFVEHQFDLAPLSPPEPIWGTSDCTLWNAKTKHLHVIDYKHGAGVVVEAEGNTQGLQYALGAAVEIAQTTRQRPETITITIVQPRAHHPDGPVRSWTITWADLVEDKKAMFAAVEAALARDAPRVVGKWCGFCKAQATCPAQMTHAMDLARVEFDVPMEVEASVPNEPPRPEDLTLVDLVNVLERADLVQDWLKSVKGYVEQLLKDGVDVPGYKLVEGRKHRQWTDEAKADSFLARNGVKAAKRYTKKLLSPAQAEKLVPKDRLPLLEKYWTKPTGDLQIARITDSRPAIRPGTEFEALPHSGD